jgi:very-short-patch-repair endonuclease
MKIYYNQKLKQLSRNLRNNSTLAEVLLWNKLKKRQMCGYQFMRQKPIGEYIVDFYCSKLKLIIEVDGETHRYKLTEDVERQDWLEDLGLSVLRFDDAEVKNDMKNVLYSIKS